jgi:probable phosphoglycerate mutase
MIELVVIRHGETDFNRQRRFQGQVDVPLNAMGELQARRLAVRLAGERFDAVVTSDLGRAFQTAALATQAHALPLTRQPLWREQAFGVLEGLDAPGIMQVYPELWARWIRHDADFVPPGGGESVRQFQQRVLDAVRRLEHSHAGRTVAVFSHGGVLDMLWRAAQGESLDGARVCDIPHTGVNRLRWHEGRVEILSWADAAHLQGLPDEPGAAQFGADPFGP